MSVSRILFFRLAFFKTWDCSQIVLPEEMSYHPARQQEALLRPGYNEMSSNY